ncbi:unnamed protein product [Periconia digitata]|uniref:F-box domain-containing protein n=1 Tax=Periconia digitata TaxID=1303443 RepID=A0A9W4XWA9_9PLEO|nr:unnamed protein product [Periconia digitata]
MSDLEGLPADVKSLIAAELHDSDSVKALRQVSRTWRAAAEPVFYRGMQWGVGRNTSLVHDDLDRLLPDDDLTSKVLRYTRFINFKEPEQYQTRSRSVKPIQTQIWPLSPAYDLIKSRTPIWYRDWDKRHRGNVERGQMKGEQMRAPFIASLARFKYLTDVVLQFSVGSSTGLITAIEKHHPRCRLHFQSPQSIRFYSHTIGWDEHAIVKSSCLHSLAFTHSYYAARPITDHETLAPLRSGRLPRNLKHVRITGHNPWKHNFMNVALRGQPREEWRGFIPATDDEAQAEEGKDERKPRLESLRILGYKRSIDIPKLELWQGLADLSNLKSLTLTTKDEAFLAHVASNNPFPKLDELNITLEPIEQATSDSWQLALENFFHNLPPLRSLDISGVFREPELDTIAKVHGATLRRLKFDPQWNQNDDRAEPSPKITAQLLERLASNSPNLSEFTLTVRRTMGDQAEVLCYEALGMLKRLKHLTLNLDCNNGGRYTLLPEKHWSDFDKAIQLPEGTPKRYNGHLKMEMVNSALDEDLVRQIWGVIKGHHSRDGLQTLVIKTYGAGESYYHSSTDLNVIINELSRSYKVTSKPDGTGGLHIVELSKTLRERNRARQHRQPPEEKSKQDSRIRLKEGKFLVFDNIWPYNEGEDFRTKWKSWPLQREQTMREMLTPHELEA